jgi:2-dehydro-3-deoxygluconokinase
VADHLTRDREEGAVKVVCLGETMLMFAPSEGELIEHSAGFTAYIGGSEANVAVGLERLGMHAGWIGKLPRNALASKIVNGIRAQGVDTSACVWTDEGRVGIFFVEWGAHPRPLRTIYDRAGSAASTLTADDLDWDYIGRADWLHVTGITPALSETCRVSTPLIVARARERGCRVSFDVNYRSLLWSVDAARAACHEILPHVNLLIATEADAAMLLGRQLARDALPQGLFDTYRPEAVVITCGADGSLAYDGRHLYRAPAHRVHAVNRLGAGDAFAAGLLYGALTSDLAAGLDCGAAMAALKMTLGQNMPLINPEDVESLLSGRKRGLIR